MPAHTNPGVHVEESPLVPLAIVEVPTAVPAFVGYTERAKEKTDDDLRNVPTRIGSLPEFESRFGPGPRVRVEEVALDDDGRFVSATIANDFHLHDSIRLYFGNGGGPCYVVSVGDFDDAASADELVAGIEALRGRDEPTILLFPDAAALAESDLATVQRAALDQCGALGDRFAVLDVRRDDPLGASFRSLIGGDNLRYGAAYSPWLSIAHPKNVGFAQIKDSICRGGHAVTLRDLAADRDLEALVDAADAAGDEAAAAAVEERLLDGFDIYATIMRGIHATATLCPPSGAVVGAYATVDRQRGVWKAPANVRLAGVIGPAHPFDIDEANGLNVDPVAGKSINAIRAFAGKGTLVWGARTLAGNDGEWRYVAVRRFLIMVEESIRTSTRWAVFEPNADTTWMRLRGVIDDYLTRKWRDGALAGATPKEAFYVRCGLGVTMSAQDLLDGRLHVEIGIAVLRPAEFISLRISHRLQTC